MSELAERERVVKRGWAAPGGFHDYLVRLLKVALPTAVGVLLAYLLLSPLGDQDEASFLLDKDKVDVARERLRVQKAQYRGQDDNGRAFVIDAVSAVQASSREAVVDINGMSAQILLGEGPAVLTADQGRYDLVGQKVAVAGPVRLAASDGYRLETRDVTVDFNSQTMASDGRVEGQMPLGRFSADRLTASIPDRRVALQGRARLHIVQGGLRGR
jgi:lipopolysaccharide export system protein LptC